MAPAIVAEVNALAPVPTAVLAPAMVAEAKALAPAPTAVLAPAMVAVAKLLAAVPTPAIVRIALAPPSTRLLVLRSALRTANVMLLDKAPI